MAKKISYETMKSFVIGLPCTLFHNGKLAFSIEAKNDKNRFRVIFVDEFENEYSVNASQYDNSRNSGIPIAKLNALFKEKYPDIMLRGNRTISYDDLVSKYLDEHDVIEAVFAQIRSKFNTMLKNCYHSPKYAQIHAHKHWNAPANISSKCTLPLSSFDELLIWIEMNQI